MQPVPTRKHRTRSVSHRSIWRPYTRTIRLCTRSCSQPGAILTTPDQVLEGAERSIEILIEAGADPTHLEQAINSVMRDLAAAGLDAANLQASVRCPGWNTDGYFATAILAQIAACLETGAVNLNALNASGMTPLHSAAANTTNNPAVIEALLVAGANLETRNEYGENAPCMRRPSTTRIRP